MTTRVKFEEADASVTTIKLENVALASELKNAKSEAQRFKEQLQHFFDENLFINSQRTELSAKAERLADELAEAKKRSKEFIQHDKEEQIRVLDGLRLELGSKAIQFSTILMSANWKNKHYYFFY